ncbi:MAG: hypothetical protein K2X81_26680, partial [Candidatus Obscuribacterales bacterium]|nr:hypothetical protein [Candidatus Obscuribacterales bacterium]
FPPKLCLRKPTAQISRHKFSYPFMNNLASPLDTKISDSKEKSKELELSPYVVAQHSSRHAESVIFITRVI